jgi:hypothetical protein
MGLSLHARAASLALMAVLLAAGTYCRRFGPRGFNGGVLAFMGAFLGFFLQDLVTVADMGWLAAEIGLGVAVTIAIHFTLFRPRRPAALRRMQFVCGAHDWRATSLTCSRRWPLARSFATGAPRRSCSDTCCA